MLQHHPKKESTYETEETYNNMIEKSAPEPIKPTTKFLNMFKQSELNDCKLFHKNFQKVIDKVKMKNIRSRVNYDQHNNAKTVREELAASRSGKYHNSGEFFF